MCVLPAGAHSCRVMRFSLPCASAQGHSLLSPRCVPPVVRGDSPLALVHSTLMFIKGSVRQRTGMRPLGLKSRHCVTSDEAQSAYPYTLPNLTIFVPEDDELEATRIFSHYGQKNLRTTRSLKSHCAVELLLWYLDGLHVDDEYRITCSSTKSRSFGVL